MEPKYNLTPEEVKELLDYIDSLWEEKNRSISHYFGSFLNINYFTKYNDAK